MTPEHWRRVNQIFHYASELPHEAQAAFLQSQCGDDAEIQALVRSMLDAELCQGLLDESPWSAFFSAIAANRGESPSAAPLPLDAPAFQPGKVLSSRYRILRFVSRGGMGEVYEAEDLEFSDHIALKTILPAIATQPDTLSRFKQEIQLSRKIAHPNVCRVFDLARDPAEGAAPGQTTYFLTMEFLSGETLAARLGRDGPMPESSAFPLLDQMAAALDAAHTAGVIHRDLKPSNVMLVPASGGSRAVITDFGLARSISGEGVTAQQTARIMGTIDYMAPELFAGRPASIASDIYAFGVVVRKVLGDALSSNAARTIEQALQPDPARRPGSAGEFVRSVTGERSAGQSLTRRVPDLKKRAVLMLALLLIGAVALWFSVSRFGSRGAGISPGSSVYLMELNNATDDPEMDATGTLLRIQLRQSAHLQLLDAGRAARARTLIADGGKTANTAAVAREVALRAGAALVIFSMLTRVADNYDLTVDIQRVGATPFAARKEWRRDWLARSKPQIFASVRDAADWVRSVAGEDPADVAGHDLPPEEAASSSWEALRLYQEAEALKDKREVDSAIAVLRRAITIDPDFALAHVRLADYLSGIRRQEEAFEHYQFALAAAAKRRLANWEELQLRGNYSLDLGDYAGAEGAYADLRSLYPHDYIPVHDLAAAVRFQGRLDQAVQLERQVMTLAPEYIGAITAAMQDYLLLGRFDNAEAMAKRLGDLGLPAMSEEYQGVVQYQRGNYAAAEVLFQKGMQDLSAFRRSRAVSLLAALKAESGAYRAAISLYENGLAADLAAGMPEQAAQKHLAIAILRFRNKENALARIHSLEAVRQLRFLVVFRRAASILARSGYPADARNLLDDLARWPGPLAESARSYIQGEIFMAEGDYANAVREFQAVDRSDSPLILREYLARGYAASGDGERALFLYQSSLRSWGPFWLYADSELPALRTNMMIDYAALALRQGHPDQAGVVLRQYFSLRPNADPGLPETATAARLAAALSTISAPNRKDKL
jgi:tetratricopeptide (TPR) repeat protein